jgi:ribosome-binding protein aMBF1 (putative translation factor)
MSIKSTVPSFASHPDSMISKVRRDRGMTIESLSLRTCINPDVLRYWERNNRYPQGDTLRTLARALQVKAGVLTGKKPFLTQKGDIHLAVNPGGAVKAPQWFIDMTKRIQTLFPHAH